MWHTDGMGGEGMWNEYESTRGGHSREAVALTLLKQTAGNTRVINRQALKGWTIELDNDEGEGGMGMFGAEPEDG